MLLTCYPMCVHYNDDYLTTKLKSHLSVQLSDYTPFEFTLSHQQLHIATEVFLSKKQCSSLGFTKIVTSSSECGPD